VVKISITPKLGPYGSGPKYVEVNVHIDLMPEVEKVDWNTMRESLNKTFTVNVPILTSK